MIDMQENIARGWNFWESPDPEPCEEMGREKEKGERGTREQQAGGPKESRQKGQVTKMARLNRKEQPKP